MGMPIIPDIKPTIEICRKEVINLLLASIALEELGLAHIINAEGEKIEQALKNSPSIDDVLKINSSVNKTIQSVMMKEMLLQFKLENILELNDKGHRK